MKNFISLLTLATASLASAEPKVEIKSFVIAGSRTNAAEVCGLVTDVVAPLVIVEVKVDGKGKNPGYYSTVVNRDGKFCVAVVAWEGTAEAYLASPAKRTLGSGTARLDKDANTRP